MSHGEQAKMLTPQHEPAVLTYLQTRRSPARDRVMFFVDQSWVTAKEIALLTWSMVTDANGQSTDVMALLKRASQGHGGGHLMPLPNL